MSTVFSRTWWESEAKAAWLGLGRSEGDPHFDPFRHAYTSALWAKHLGERIATEAGNYIERTNRNNFNRGDPGHRDMRGDLLNNAIGRGIGAAGGYATSDQELAVAILVVLERGELITQPQLDPRTLEANFPAALWPFPHSDVGTWEIEGLPVSLDAAIDVRVNTQFGSSRKNSSPLVLDLDGDGVEITRLSGAITFDHDADLVRTGTAWVGADDGLLAMDRDGDGLIQSGRELFGDNTQLPGGAFADDGYEALRALDSSGDGVLDASDAEYSQLRVWRDVDQDGMSDSGELWTLEEIAIDQISLAAVGFTQMLEDGTRLDGTRLDGVGSFLLGGESRAYTDAWFAENPFHRNFTTPVEPSAATATLPSVEGSGAVRDLREAATLSPVLGDLLVQFAAVGTRDAQRALLEPLLVAWAETSEFVTLSDWAKAGHAVTFDLHQLDPAATSVWRERIAVLEAFNGQNFVALKSTANTHVWTGSTRQRLLEESWSALEDSVYGALALQTRLKPYLDAVVLMIDGTGVRWDGSSLESLLIERRDVDLQQALFDLADLMVHASASMSARGVEAQFLLRTWMSDLPEGSFLPGALREMGLGLGFGTAANERLDGTGGSDAILGAGGDDELLGLAGDDALSGDGGSDLLRGGAGQDALDGGDGNDRLYGGGDDDQMFGGMGGDRLYGDAGDDVLHGGAGNDYLNGGAGSDVYRFGRGDGKDEIHNPEYLADNDVAVEDKLFFCEGIEHHQLWFRRENSHLEVSVMGTDDVVRLNGWYSSTPTRIDAVETASGDTLFAHQVDALVQAMAAFAPPPPGQILLTSEQQAVLTPVLAASWG